MLTQPKAIVDLNRFRVRTIRLGMERRRSADELRAAMRSHGICIDDVANDLLSRSLTRRTELQVGIIAPFTGELGFTAGAFQKDIYRRVLELGGGICPGDLGPQFRVEHLKQPLGGNFTIGMEPIRDSLNKKRLFRVGHDGHGLVLGADRGEPDDFWSPWSRWIFLIRPLRWSIRSIFYF